MKLTILATAFSLLALPAFAQDTDTLARQYVNMPEVQNMIDEMFSPATMGNQVAASLPTGFDLNDSQKQRIGIVMSEAMNGLRPRMEAIMISSSAETFSAEELKALIDFYASETGAAVMQKMPNLMTNVMGQLQPEMLAMQQSIASEIGRIIQE